MPTVPVRFAERLEPHVPPLDAVRAVQHSPAPRRGIHALPVLTALVSGCGGGAATMHPAHTLPPARVTIGAGVSSNFSFGKLDEAVSEGRSATAVGAAPESPEQDVVDGAIAHAMTTEGVSPWLGGRVGLPQDNEAGLTYTGRSARIDGRHAFQDESLALSVGAGASVILLRSGSAKPPGNDEAMEAGRFTAGVDDFDATGWGIDVPIVVGWRSTGSVVQVWGGLRAGYEQARGNLPTKFDPAVPLGDAGSESTAAVTADRWFGGLLAGIAVGLKPFWVALELDAVYQGVSGETRFAAESGMPTERSFSGSGVTLAPTGAFIGKF